MSTRDALIIGCVALVIAAGAAVVAGIGYNDNSNVFNTSTAPTLPPTSDVPSDSFLATVDASGKPQKVPMSQFVSSLAGPGLKTLTVTTAATSKPSGAKNVKNVKNVSPQETSSSTVALSFTALAPSAPGLDAVFPFETPQNEVVACTRAQLMDINTLPLLQGNITNSDIVQVYDVSSASMRKLTKGNFVSGTPGFGTVTSITVGSGLTTGIFDNPIESNGSISLDIGGLPLGVSSPGDFLAFYDGADNKKVTKADFLNGAAVTSITAGNGLTGGTIVGSGTLAFSVDALATSATTVSPADLIPISQNGTTKRIARSALFSGVPTSSNPNLVINPLTASRALISDTSGNIANSVTASSRLSYLANVTSDIQQQLNNRVTTSQGVGFGTLTLPLSSTKVLYIDQSLDINASSITDTELAQLSGVTDNIQGQLDYCVRSEAKGLTIGSLESDRVMVTAVGGEIATSEVTGPELNFVQGVTSAIQTQLNNKLGLSGGTLSGGVQLPSSSVSAPALGFAGQSAGISSTGMNLVLSTNTTNRLSIDSAGNITAGTLGLGVLHASAGGLLSSSQVVGDDIALNTIPTNRLQDVSFTSSANKIVVRDGTGAFEASKITLTTLPIAANDAATKGYVDTVSVGIVPHEPARLCTTSNSSLAGLTAIDGVVPVGGDRILVVVQTNQVQNGIYVASSGSWARALDMQAPNVVGRAYVLVTEGQTEAGNAFLCSTPSSVVGTDPIVFTLFSSPNDPTGLNLGSGSPIFAASVGNQLQFRTLVCSDNTVSFSNDTQTVTINTNSASASTPSTLVLRDASGNFAASTITASLTGLASLNLPLTGGTMSGSITMPFNANPTLKFGTATCGVGSTTTNELTLFTNGTAGLVITPTTLQLTTIATGTPGIVHASNVGSATVSLVVDADIASNTISDSKLQTIVSGGKVSNSATTATSSNSNGAIVSRDGSGNFAASTITASLVGLASLNLPLTGGTLTGALQIPVGNLTVPGLTFGSGNMGICVINPNEVTLAAAGAAVFSSSAVSTTITSLASIAGVVHSSSSGLLSNSLIVNADIANLAINDSKLQQITSANKVANSATTATPNNVISTLVERDVNGSFGANVVTASLTGLASLNLPLAGGTLTGTLSLPNGSTLSPSLVLGSAGVSGGSTFDVSFGGTSKFKVSPTGITMSSLDSTGLVHADSNGLLSSSLLTNGDIADATIQNTKLATGATSAATPSTFVLRDVNGAFSASSVTLNDGSPSVPSLILGTSGVGVFGSTGEVGFATGSLERLTLQSDGTVTMSAYGLGVVHCNSSGDLSSSLIVGSDISGNTIPDSKLQTISAAGKVSNTATTADPDNTPSTIVMRDGTGDFSANVITASLAGLASLNLPLAGGTLTGNLTLPVGSVGSPSLLFGSMGLSGGATSFDVSSSGVSRFSVGVGGGVTLSSLAFTGVVHANSAGLLSSSLIVNDDIAGGTISNDRLATLITSSATGSSIVLRNSGGSFSTTSITLGTAGSASSPSLVLDANAGIYGSSGGVFISTNNTDRVTIASNGTLTLVGFGTGLVHSDASGVLTSSLVVTADIANLAVTDAKISPITASGKVANSATTATSSNVVSAIVARNGSGDISVSALNATSISCSGAGSVTNLTLTAAGTGPNDAATRSYVDAAAVGIIVKTPALVHEGNNFNTATGGLPVIDGVQLVANDRVLLTGQTNAVDNGIYLAAAGAWSRSADMADGSSAKGAYVLIQAGTIGAGESFINSSTATVGTNPLNFVQFSQPVGVSGTNLGPGVGVFASATGNNLSFKTLSGTSNVDVSAGPSNNVLFDLKTDITVVGQVNSSTLDVSGAASTGALTVSGTLALGANSLTSTGSISCASLAASGAVSAASLSVTTGTSALQALTATTLTTSGAVVLQNTTDSTGVNSGALQIDGGVGIEKKVFIGDECTVQGILKAVGTDASTSPTTGALVVTGGLGVGGALFGTTCTFSGDCKITSSTASAGTTSGALVVSGGVGVGGALFGTTCTMSGAVSTGALTVGGALVLGANTMTTSGAVSTGALTVGGTLSMGSNAISSTGSVNCATLTATGTVGGNVLSATTSSSLQAATATTISASGNVSITSNMPSTSTGTGALVVTGGVGIGGALFGTTCTMSGAVSTGALTVGGTLTMGSSAISSTGTVNCATLTATGTVGGNVLSATTSSSLQAATATTISASGIVSLTSITPSSSTGTGALVVTGGVGIGGAMFGTTCTMSGAVSTGALTVGGALALGTNTITTSGSVTTGALTVNGALSTGSNSISCNNVTATGTVGANVVTATLSSSLAAVTSTSITASGIVDITNTTGSSSQITGALKVAGGIGVQGALFGSSCTMSGTAAVNALTVATTANITGATTGAACTFSGDGKFTSGTASTNTTSGALTVTGGLGLSGALFGTSCSFSGTATTGALTVNGAVALGANTLTTSGSVNTGALTVGGTLALGSNSMTCNGVTATGTVQAATLTATTSSSLGAASATTVAASGVVSLTNVTPSSSTVSGALVVSGGVGIGGALFGTTANFSGACSLGASTLSSLTVTNAAGIGGNLTGTTCTFSGDAKVTSTTASSSSTSGALVVDGGVGVAGAINVAGTLQSGAMTVNGNIALNSFNLTTTGAISTGTGSAAANSLDFGTANTGLNGGSSTVNISVSGVNRLVLVSSSLTSSVPVYVPVGSAAAPVLGNATTTGLFFPTSEIGFSTGGTQRGKFQTTGELVLDNMTTNQFVYANGSKAMVPASAVSTAMALTDTLAAKISGVPGIIALGNTMRMSHFRIYSTVTFAAATGLVTGGTPSSVSNGTLFSSPSAGQIRYDGTITSEVDITVVVVVQGNAVDEGIRWNVFKGPTGSQVAIAGTDAACTCNLNLNSPQQTASTSFATSMATNDLIQLNVTGIQSSPTFALYSIYVKYLWPTNAI